MVISSSSVFLSRLSYTKNVLKCSNKLINILPGSFNNLRLYSVDYAGETENTKSEDSVKKEKISKAMRAYLERAKKYDEFMQKENTEFKIGKRHLANMMGENYETMTQNDVNKSIEYLFPSGLFEPRARPMMRPPKEIFPPKKAAEFDESGRPFHSMFYTSKPNYYQLLYDIVSATNMLKHQRALSRNSNTESESTKDISLTGSVWLTKTELQQILIEPLIDRDYAEFVLAMERLIQYPDWYKVKDLIQKYRKPLLNQANQLVIPKLQYTAEGRPYAKTENCMRKSARGEVTVWGNGTGKITINGQSILYFTDVQAREQIIFPLIFTGLSTVVDVEATVKEGGQSGQAGAIRWGIAWSLRSFVGPHMVEQMRVAGLLKRDARTRERKKPGQAGARKKFTWKKR